MNIPLATLHKIMRHFELGILLIVLKKRLVWEFPGVCPIVK